MRPTVGVFLEPRGSRKRYGRQPSKYVERTLIVPRLEGLGALESGRSLEMFARFWQDRKTKSNFKEPRASQSLHRPCLKHASLLQAYISSSRCSRYMPKAYLIHLGVVCLSSTLGEYKNGNAYCYYLTQANDHISFFSLS